MGSQLNLLTQKRSKLEAFIEVVSKDKEKITCGSLLVQKEAKAKFDELRKILEEKEREMEEAIKRMESTKQNTLNNEITKAQQVHL